MSDKKNKNEEFDPENDKEIENGPLKSEHINQYGKKDNKRTSRESSKRLPDEDEEER